MTLFGTTLDGQQIFGLVSLLALLALWSVSLGRERRYTRWIRRLDADRKARRQAQGSPRSGDGGDDAGPRGPWG